MTTTLSATAKRLREEKGLSQGALASSAGLIQSQISRIESGKTGADYETLRKLAAALDVTVATLTGEAETEPSGAVVHDGGDGPVTWVHLKALTASPLNPRKSFPEEAIEELALSIATNGLLQPLTGRLDTTIQENIPGALEIYIGGRRLRALNRLYATGRWPLDHLPGHRVPVIRRDADDLDLLKLAGAENINRADMHPLEEGDLFAELQRRGYGTDQIAETYGKTKRWVELRIQVATGLDAETRDLFAAGTINFEAARQLVRLPDTARAAHAAAMAKGDQRYKTAADLAARITEGLPRVRAALFDRAAYSGEIVTDETWEKAERFSDIAQFNALQTAAIEAKRAELGERWAFVEVIRLKKPESYASLILKDHGFDRLYARTDPKLHGAAIIVQPDLSAEVVEGVCRGTAPAEPTKATLKASGDPVAAVGTSRREHAHRVKTMALQTAILGRGHRAALEMAIVALLGDGTVAKIKTEAAAPDSRALAPLLVERLTAWRDRLGAKAFREVDPSGQTMATLEFAGAWGADRAPRAAAFAAITKLTDAELADLFDALVASRCGSWPSYGSVVSLGDEALTIVAAERYGVDMAAAPVIDDLYVARLQRDELMSLVTRVNLWCIARNLPDMDLGDVNRMKVTELRATIAQHVAANDVRLVPPELTFATDKAIEAELRAPLLKPKAATAGKGNAAAAAPGPQQIDLEEAIAKARAEEEAKDPSEPPACILLGFDRLAEDIVEDLSHALTRHPHYGRIILRLAEQIPGGRNLSLMKDSAAPVTYRGQRYDDGYSTMPVTSCDDMALVRFVTDFLEAPDRFVEPDPDAPAPAAAERRAEPASGLDRLFAQAGAPIAFVSAPDSLIEPDALNALADALPHHPRFADELLTLRVSDGPEVLTLQLEDAETGAGEGDYTIASFDGGDGSGPRGAGAWDDEVVEGFIVRWIAEASAERVRP